MRPFTFVVLFVLLSIFAVGCLDSGTTSPVSGTISLSIVSGNDQEGVVGQELPNPLVVLALDNRGHPLRGGLVNFRVLTGGGSMYAGSALTNQAGIAQDYWTLGTRAGVEQTLEVRTVDPSTGAKLNFATFRAVGTPGPVTIVTVSPPSDSIQVGQTRQFEVTGVDAFDNPIADRPATWSSTDDAIATVSTTGLATGVGPGEVTIRAVMDGVSGTATLKVETGTLGSCKAIRDANPSASTGTYTIDPDGGGPISPVMVNCDMVRDGGGWTLGVKSWYLGGVFGIPGSPGAGVAGAVGTVADGITHKGNPYKLSDEVIRALIGPSMNFDVMADQSGYNSTYSTGNYEYVILRNYTALWRFDTPVNASTTQTVMQSYRRADNALAWTGELLCGFGGAGINCLTVVSNNPQGGAGCAINMGSASNSAWHHFYMSEVNSDTYLYICNGAQHSSSHDMNHRWWFRER